LSYEIQKEVMTFLAGPIAERRAAGCYNHAGNRNDREVAADLALEMNGDESRAGTYLRWVHLCTEALVKLHWREIDTTRVGRNTVSRGQRSRY
jgi:hypothetical protein